MTCQRSKTNAACQCCIDQHVQGDDNHHRFDATTCHGTCAALDFATEIGGIKPTVISEYDGGDHQAPVVKAGFGGRQFSTCRRRVNKK